MPRKTRLALIGAALAVASSGVTISMAGVASASGSPTVTTSFSGSYVNGETITVSGTGFPTRSADPSGLEILQCSSAVIGAPDASDSYCDGSTLNPLPILTNSSGAFSAAYTLSQLSATGGSNINCDATNPCTLWVGEDHQNDFTNSTDTAFSSSFLFNGVAPTMPSSNSATVAQGASFSGTITASGPPNSVFSVTGGALPSGISLSSGGSLSGTTYAAPGPYTISVRANNGVGTATQSFTLTVTATTAPLIVPVSPAAATPNVPYTLTFTAEGPLTAPVKWKAAGKLPKGLKFNKATATIAGTPTSTKHTKYGAYTVTVSFKDHAKPTKHTASEQVTIDLVP